MTTETKSNNNDTELVNNKVQVEEEEEEVKDPNTIDFKGHADNSHIAINYTKYNLPQWTTDHAASFKPPICNKLMYGGQLKVMFVGGKPNSRQDFHIDCGEEFFYQMKGNMTLPTYQCGRRQIVEINEGEVFLVRACIPHSPQRPQIGSLGLVVERDRLQTEIDALRYYVCDFELGEKDVNRVLWEKWFYCSDLGIELPPVVREFHASEQFTSHEPSATSVDPDPPVLLDVETQLAAPFNLMAYITAHEKEFVKHKQLDIYQGTQTLVRVLCGPYSYIRKYVQESWIYVMNGSCKLTFDFPSRRPNVELQCGDCVIIHPDDQYRIHIAADDNNSNVDDNNSNSNSDANQNPKPKSKSNRNLVMLVSMDTKFPEADLFAIPSKYDREKKTREPWENMKSGDPHYKQRMQERGATQQDIQQIDDNITLDKQ